VKKILRDPKIQAAIKSGKLIPVKKLFQNDLKTGTFTREQYRKTYKAEMEENSRLLRARTAKIVRSARLDKKVTQDELARRLHTSKSFISEIENGKQNISIEYASKIAKALDKEFVWQFK
jgi:ribosome-binding protein aMBF1 (putative translation factor)